MSQQSNIHINGETKNIIYYTPGFFIRHGISLFFTFILLLFFIASRIKYPDIIYTQAVLASANVPEPVIAHTSGEITKLFVKENQKVKKNELIGYIESTTSYDEVFLLSKNVEKIQSNFKDNKLETIRENLVDNFVDLGELQTSYHSFIKAALDFSSRQNEKKWEIMKLNNATDQRKAVFLRALNTLKSQIADWEKKYLLIAPIDGRVQFSSSIQKKQLQQAKCYIIPENSTYYAQIFISQANFAKVRLGQSILLKLNSYPFQEYGYLKGKIDRISNIPNNDSHIAKINLENGLYTTHNKQIQYRNGLIAIAEINANDLSLLQWLYYAIINRVKK